MHIFSPVIPAQRTIVRPPDDFLGEPNAPHLRHALHRIPAPERPAVRLLAWELTTILDTATLADCWAAAIGQHRSGR